MATCPHFRLVDLCEDCGVDAMLERGAPLPPDGRKAARPAPERPVVDVDTFVERTDLDTDAYTFVAAGDAVPLGLEDLPRHPANVDKAKRRKR